MGSLDLLVRRSSFVRWTSLIAFALGACTGAPATDAGHDADRVDSAVEAAMETSVDVPADGRSSCSSDNDCTDGLYCNGAERCMPGAAGADARGCLAANPANPCTSGMTCDEANDRCTGSNCATPDLDGDGHMASECGGDDCDDHDPNRFPGRLEVCDAAGHDEDCNAATLGPDGDGDTFPSVGCCNTQMNGVLLCGTDCDDTRATVNATAVESCNGVDDDCDGMIDEGVMNTYFVDGDGDMYGDNAMPTRTGCTAPTGYAMAGGDCNDAVASIHPGAAEIPCNGMDDDCDPATADVGTMTFYRDVDGDGYGVMTMPMPSSACTPPTGYSIYGNDCDDTNSTVHPSATELCNGRDDDCVGGANYSVGTNGEDDDGDGYPDATLCAIAVAAGGDCDDTRATVHPGATEIPDDGIDETCDGFESCYVDADNDGYRTAALTNTGTLNCTGPGLARASTPAGDCCDTGTNSQFAHPGTPWVGAPAYLVNSYTNYYTQPTPCGGWDWNCSGAEEHGPLVTNTGTPTATRTASGSCSSTSTCSGSTRTTGWVTTAPTTCGATAQYSDGCSPRTICVPVCNTICLEASENIPLDCR